MPAVGHPALPALACYDPEPNFAAIVAHKAAAAWFDTAVGVEVALEVEIPRENRQSSITAWNHVIDQSDDLRWTEAVKARKETCEAVDDLAWSFVENPPTTPARPGDTYHHRTH